MGVIIDSGCMMVWVDVVTDTGETNGIETGIIDWYDTGGSIGIDIGGATVILLAGESGNTMC